MVRQIIIPTQKTFTIELPEEFIGKQVEVLAFELDTIKNPPKKSIKEMTDFFNQHSVDMTNFKFDREEANDYE